MHNITRAVDVVEISIIQNTVESRYIPIVYALLKKHHFFNNNSIAQQSEGSFNATRVL